MPTPSKKKRRKKRAKKAPPKSTSKAPRKPPKVRMPMEYAEELLTPENLAVPIPEPGEEIKSYSEKSPGDVATRGLTPSESTLEAPADKKSHAYLRFSAGLRYTTDVNGITMEQLSKLPPFDGNVNPKTLIAWSERDKWVLRRKKIQEQWRQQIEARIGDEIVQKAIEDLEITDSILTDSVNKVLNNAGKVQSHEGMVNATIRLLTSRADMREKVLHAAVPKVGQQQQQISGMPEPKFSPEDVRAAAKAIIQRRREQIRSEREANLLTDGDVDEAQSYDDEDVGV